MNSQNLKKLLEQIWNEDVINSWKINEWTFREGRVMANEFRRGMQARFRMWILEVGDNNEEDQP